MGEVAISVLLLVLVSGAVVITGMRKTPGIGVLVAAAAIGLATWLRGQGLGVLGLSLSESWGVAVGLSLALGGVLALLSTAAIEPLAEWVTGEPHDHSAFSSLRGHVGRLLVWLVTVWILVAFLEETIFRGFLMGEVVRLLGQGAVGWIVGLAVGSVIFGLAHGYQGRSGIVSTAVMGFLFGVIYLASGRDLWLVILTHGFVDTFGLLLIYSGADRRLRTLVLRRTALPGAGSPIPPDDNRP